MEHHLLKWIANNESDLKNIIIGELTVIIIGLGWMFWKCLNTCK